MGLEHMVAVHTIIDCFFSLPCMVAVHTMIDCFLSLPCNDAVGVIESGVNIIVAIAGGICAVSGIGYISVLKKKQISATFSFWIQLRVRIEELRRALYADNSIINGLYSDEVRTLWNARGSLASDEVVKRFYNNTQETLQFIKNVSDQIPANKKWLDAYIEFISFLIDVAQYDIRNFSSSFKFTNSETLDHRQKYCKKICGFMDELLTEIDEQQTRAAKKFKI